MLYRVFDLVVDSEIDLSDFPLTGTGTPALHIRRSIEPLPQPDAANFHSVWRPSTLTRSEVAWHIAGENGDRFVVIPRCGQFHASNGLTSLVCHQFRGAHDAVFRKQISRHIVPRLLGEQGHLVLHASAVEIDGRAMVFIGASGDGKSTLAASLAAQGARLLSDDGVMLRRDGPRLVAFVNGGFARLWDDSFQTLVGASPDAVPVAKSREQGTKWTYRSVGAAHAPAGVSVAAVFDMSVPAPTADIAIKPSPAGILVARLTQCTLLLDHPVGSNRSLRFRAAADLAEACPAFYSLAYLRRFSVLPDVRAALFEAVGRRLTADRTVKAS